MKRTGGNSRLPPVFFALLLLLPAFWLLFQDGKNGKDEESLVVLSGQTMGTRYRVLLREDEVIPDGENLAKKIQQRLDYLDKELMSTYVEDSQLSRLNASPPGLPMPVAPEMIAVFTTARQVNSLSGGAFDITVKPLVDLWGFGPAAVEGIPSQGEVDKSLELTGMGKFVIDPGGGTIGKNSEVYADLSGIAKGYAVDQIADLLDAGGLNDYLVEIGGELIVKGNRAQKKETAEPWRIGIENPVPGESTLFRNILSNGEKLAMAGSGSYRNFFEYQGKRYSHTIDPVTGRPVEHKLVSVTVVSGSAMLADAWATALLVLGPEEGMKLANKLQLAAYFILEDEGRLETRHSEPFSSYMQ